MRLVDGEPVAAGGAQGVERAGTQQPFRRHVEELEPVLAERGLDIRGIGAGIAGMQRAGRHALGL